MCKGIGFSVDEGLFGVLGLDVGFMCLFMGCFAIFFKRYRVSFVRVIGLYANFSFNHINF